ncbi:hypothetical protein F5H01DRAFT_354344 [Linnemannia elongata]|nr:hypothetical protein F5H01DRAFT_354344 [Linnemannia elongata]
MTFLFIPHGTTTHLSVSLMLSLLFFTLVQGGTGQESKRGEQRREKEQKRRKTKVFPQLIIDQCSDLTNTALQAIKPTDSANTFMFFRSLQ